ncbi:MAG TPA: S46 family peptidase [Longimicrobiales bacterium]|nr:S46 family peptidase [Longimicrobiales bacterium]
MKLTHLPPAAVLAALLLALPAGAQQATQVARVAPGSVPEFGTMWTFDAPPLDYWQARYGFRPDEAWLDHLRLAAVRLPGCSSSFVSPDGLIMTNHHCARSCIAQVSPAETNYLRTGFTAATREQEVRCPGTYVDQLVSIEDVTARIRGAVTASAAAGQVAERDAAIQGIQAACEKDSGLRCQVVAFYSGGMYSLYKFRRYEDVRLVFAPEQEAAAFGGDPDNFTYPRFDLDVSFMRAYENGQPLRPAHWLTWSEAGAADGEAVFVVGNPGSTGRLLTLAQMEYLRDVSYPASLADFQRRLALLRRLSAESAEAARTYEVTILGIENSYKATNGYLTGLLDEGIMARKAAFEKDFRSRIEADAALKAKYGSAWGEIADAQLELATFAMHSRHYAMGGSTLAGRALSLVRLARQAALPAAERLPGWDDAGMDRARQALLRDQPLDAKLETGQLAMWLATAQAELGASDPLVRAFLQGRAPEAAAQALVAGSTLGDLAARRALVEGGAAAVQASKDPFVAAVRELEPVANGYVKRAAQLNAVVSANTEKLGQAIFAAYGTALPPDATFTLRISDGVVKGFPYNGTIAPYKTSFYGLYARSAEFDDRPPFQLTDRWKLAVTKVDMRTPMNFVSTADIIGGNSGSPVVNRAGEVVGLVFDGNIEMLPNRFLFTDEVSRCVSVHSLAITEALAKVYDAAHIAAELKAARR